MRPEKIAFIGLGAMCAGMASCLCKAGFALTVHNRSPEKMHVLAAQGASIANSPALAVQDADVVITMLGDDDASRNVWLGEQGILSGKPRVNAVMVECSTLSLAWVTELSDLVHQQNYRYLDLPVTGLPDHAAAGQLTLLAGGDCAVLEEIEQLTTALSIAIHYFGDIGSATAYKLMVNLAGGIQIAAVAEVMLMAQRYGLDQTQVASALASSAAGSLQVQITAPRMLAQHAEDDVVFAAKWRHKDTAYALQLAQQLAVDVPLGKQTLDYYAEALALGYGDADQAKVFASVEARHLEADQPDDAR